MNIKNLIKTFIILIIIFIIYNITIEHNNYQKFYNSYDDKKLAEVIEKKLEKAAINVKNSGKSISINLNELIVDEKIEKICIIGPYSPDMNKLIGVYWNKTDNWEKSVVNDDSVFSIFFIQRDYVIPVKIKLMKLRPEGQVCIENKKDTVFNLYNKNNKVFVYINNKK